MSIAYPLRTLLILNAEASSVPYVCEHAFVFRILIRPHSLPSTMIDDCYVARLEYLDLGLNDID